MKTTIFAFLLISGISLQAQDAIDKYFGYLSKDTTMSSVTVNAKMFELFSYMETDDDDAQEFKEMMQNMESLRVLVKENAANGKAMFNTAIKKPGKEFEVLMDVNTEGELFKFLINEKDGIVSEFLMIGFTQDHGEPKFIVLSLTGKIDLAQISKLSRTMNIKEMKHLDKIDED